MGNHGETNSSGVWGRKSDRGASLSNNGNNPEREGEVSGNRDC